MKRLLEEMPSIPHVPSTAPLHLGITTRVMARRQSLEKERKNSLSSGNGGNTADSSRRSSKFLEGAAIPNSVLRKSLQEDHMVAKDSKTRRRERDEYVQQLIQRIQPQRDMFRSIYNEDVDREALTSIKKELQKRSLMPLIRRYGIDKDKQHAAIANANAYRPSNKGKAHVDPWEELKEKRRIAQRTRALAPLTSGRRPTYDSIKEAIQNSKAVQQLLNADNIEEQKVKQIQTEKSLIAMKGSMTSRDSITNLKSSKRVTRRGLKRKTSLKSEKSANLPGDKVLPKKKAYPDIRKRTK